MIEITEWTILSLDFETAEEAPRFVTEAAAVKFQERYGIEGLVVGLVDVQVTTVD